MNEPTGILSDGAGSIYISDYSDFRIRKIDPQGKISTVAGNGVFGYTGDGGPATAASIGDSAGLALDKNGNLYIADTYFSVIRKVTPDGRISTVAGTGTTGYGGDGGPASAAKLNTPYAVACDNTGNLYIADTNNHRIRMVSLNGTISTIAGTGQDMLFRAGGVASTSPISSPEGLAFDAAGNLFFSSYDTATVSKIDLAGRLTLYAGVGYYGVDSGDGGPATQATLLGPQAIAVDVAGNLYIAEYDGQRIRKINPGGSISTLAGNGAIGYTGDGGQAGQAQFNFPWGVTVDNRGMVYVTDQYNQLVRKIDTSVLAISAVTGTASQLGDGGPAISAQILHPTQTALDAAGNVYVADSENNRIRMITPSGTITTVAGDGTPGFSGDGGPAKAAQLLSPEGVGIDPFGSILIADTGNNRIRRINAAGNISTIAGSGIFGFSGDGLAALKANMAFPMCVRSDANGNLYIADSLNGRIRKVTATGTISTIAGSDSAFINDGLPAAQAGLGLPTAVSVDASNNLYIADTLNNRIRKVDGTSGLISTIAGGSKAGFGGDGGPATAALLNTPHDVVPDGKGNLFISDTFNARIRMVTGNGTISTIAGTGGFGATGDGSAALNAQIASVSGLAIDATGAIYAADSYNNRIRKFIPQAALPGDFTITVDAANKSVSAGSSIAFTLTITSVNGFAGNITLGQPGGLPPGSVVFSPASPVAVATGQTVTVKATISVASTTVAGATTVTFNANAGGLQHTVSTVISVTPAPTNGPVISQGGIANAASFLAGAVSPGEIVTIYGSLMGPAALTTLQLDSNGKVATTLAGTKVTFNGNAAPLIYASAGQISAVVPYEVAGSGSAAVQVTYNGAQSNTITVQVTDAAPALFTYNSSGAGAAAIANQDGSVNTPANPAGRGTVIVLYGTGEGQTNPGGVDGQVATAIFPAPVLGVSVMIGGQPATVAYKGAAPGDVAGVIQMNVTVPAGIAPGAAVPVSFTVGSKTSPSGVTIAVN